MATYKAPKSVSKRQELRKDAATTTFVRLQDFFTDNRQVLTYSAIGVVVLLVAIFSIRYIQSNQANRADEALGGILSYYEDGEFRTALDGAGEDIGLIDISDQYGSTNPGKLARLYAGNAAFMLGEMDLALEMFESYGGGDDMLKASALDGRATIHEVREEYDEAASLYERAAKTYESPIRTPEYLKKAARAYAKAEEYAKAEDILVIIQEDYPDSGAAEDLDFHLGFVRAKML